MSLMAGPHATHGQALDEHGHPHADAGPRLPRLCARGELCGARRLDGQALESFLEGTLLYKGLRSML